MQISHNQSGSFLRNVCKRSWTANSVSVGIRTPGRFPVRNFQDFHHRPLGHADLFAGCMLLRYTLLYPVIPIAYASPLLRRQKLSLADQLAPDDQTKAFQPLPYLAVIFGLSERQDSNLHLRWYGRTIAPDVSRFNYVPICNGGIRTLIPCLLVFMHAQCFTIKLRCNYRLFRLSNHFAYHRPFTDLNRTSSHQTSVNEQESNLPLSE